MIKKALKIIGALLGLALIVLAVFAVNAIWFRPWSLNVFYEKVFIGYALENPQLLTSIGIAEQFGYRAHNAHLDDVSIEHELKEQAQTRQNLADLQQYAVAKQTPSQQLSTRVLTWFLQNHIEGEKFAFHNYPVNQLFGEQNRLPDFMVNLHRIPDRKSAEQYLARLGEWGRKFDQVIAGLKYREAHGVIPPRFVIGRVLKEMREFAGRPAKDNVLATSFAKKLEPLTGISAADKAALQAQVEAAITTNVYPAYQRLIEYFAALEPKATTDDGVWKLPDGDAYYAYALHSHTTSNLTPQQVHDLGLSEVNRIETLMRAILDREGRAGGTPAEWIQRLAKDDRYLFPNTDDGRARALALYTSLIDESLERSKKFFGLMPVAKIEVRRIPEFKEATAPGAYYQQPALDGSRPGVFYANLRDMHEVPRFGMKTLAYHEGVPGHHFQIAIAQELKGLPTFRKVLPFTAYAEGWALYSEWLAVEMGLYHDDPYGNLGRLRDEMMRAVRLVVDTGIHYKHWTREQAIGYMMGKTGMGEAEVTSEVERYIVMPGQACAYKVGMLKIRELRARAEKELGQKFILKEFHDTVLGNGAMPLDILEQLVNEWIAKKKGA